MDLSVTEITVIRNLVRNLRRIDGRGNYMTDFSKDRVGRKLFRKMEAAGWVEWTGWYLSGKGCYRLSARGRKEARALGQSVTQKEPMK